MNLIWRLLHPNPDTDFSSMDLAVAEARKTEGAALIDVRSAEEVALGVVPGALWVPMDQLGAIEQLVPNKETPLFVYCKSGGRASRAVEVFGSLGYTTCTNAGGVLTYTGALEPLA